MGEWVCVLLEEGGEDVECDEVECVEAVALEIAG